MVTSKVKDPKVNEPSRLDACKAWGQCRYTRKAQQHQMCTTDECSACQYVTPTSAVSMCAAPTDACSADACSADECSADGCSNDECSADEYRADKCSADECSADECSADECSADEYRADECNANAYNTAALTKAMPMSVAPQRRRM